MAASGAADGFHQSGQTIVVIVALTVVAHGGALGDGPGVLQRDMQRPVAGVRRDEERFHGVDGLAHIASAGGGDVGISSVFRRDSQAGFVCHVVYGAQNGLFHVRRGDGFEFKNRAAAENGVEDIKIGIFRRRGNQSDLAVFDVL